MNKQSEFIRNQAAQDEVIDKMMGLYNPPTHLRENPKAQEQLIEIYLKKLGEYSRETLKSAWEKVVSNPARKGWSWPALGEIVEACEYFRPVDTTEEKARDGELEGIGDDIDRIPLCEAALMSPFGQMALREGWGHDIWIEVMRTGRSRPFHDSEAQRFRESVKAAHKALNDMPKDATNMPMSQALLDAWNAKLWREQELAKKYVA